MIDIHSHIIPGGDDGSVDMKTSVAMLQAAKEAGVTSLIATPHKKHPVHEKDARVAKYFPVLRQMAAEMGIRLTLGWEYNLRAVDVDRAVEARQFCIGDTCYLLLELPFDNWPFNWERILFQIQAQGIHVILAHPERLAPIQNDLSLLDLLAQDDCLFEVNAESVLKRFGKRSAVVKHLAQMERIDFIASDAHRPQDFETLAQALSFAEKKRYAPVYTDWKGL